MSASIKIKGIDVSRWQENIDWAKVKQDGVEFALIKACQEAGFTDSCFKTNIEGAQRNGIKCGVYSYSKALTAAGMEAEARYFLNIVKPYKLDYPMVLDLEDNVQKSLGKKAITDMVIAYRKVIEGAGQRFMLYTNTDWRKNYVETDRLGDVLLWQAHYPPNPEIRPPAIDDKVSIWQYSSTGKVAGITGNVDMNWGFADLADTTVPLNPSASLKIGDSIGDVLYSDIAAYINARPIPASIADNKTLIVVEDLANYGFDVTWNGKDRVLKAERNKNKAFTPLPVEKLPAGKKSGDFKCKYVYTDIKTYLSGEIVKNYAIDGRTLIDFELLAKYGKISWDGQRRELKIEIN